ncbi:hypothetical protein Ppa06_39190 [Planomonospora parontospora subsp. parontospora]|uniref:Uncharacterized protein n=2 Tax=Planomonospora parontospora TaxID=58119 RepID=A0AA37BIL5_9ACTN|nr:hypothetical protein [Planomonospora parontospora]GGK76543.1 hypothetical protein GCM10010126_39720 [Planomonospora parontospora]GII10121.1 hypothetical protein Ppa06_39190 [Planomonospora parontospora subsp. parontospora]
MTIADSQLSTASPDVRPLLADYREQFVPAAVDYLERRISANELRRRWKPHYLGPFHAYDLTVERAWRETSGSTGVLESGAPPADPRFATPLQHFPVSIAYNNLDRLIEVLAIELGDRTVDQTKIRERTVDFAHVIDSLDALMASLAD